MLSIALAQITNKATPSLTGDGTTFFGVFIPKMITIVFIIGGIAFMFMLLLGAVKWITSGGDKAQVESARTQITQALTGLVVMFSVWAIANLVKSIFGVDLIHIDLTSLIQ